MQADPERRTDGRCARPGCGKPLRTAPPKTMPKSLLRQFMHELNSEMFCSTVCAREFHGVPLKATGQGAHMADDEAA